MVYHGVHLEKWSRRGKSWQLKSLEDITSFFPSSKWGARLTGKGPPFAPHLKMKPRILTNCKQSDTGQWLGLGM